MGVIVCVGRKGNVKKSIIDGVHLSDLRIADEALVRELSSKHPDGFVRMWGFKEKVRYLWRRARLSKYALFTYHPRQALYAGKISLVYPFNEDDEKQLEVSTIISTDVWGRDLDGQTWKYLVFLSDVREVLLGVETLNDLTGYKLHVFRNSFYITDNKAMRLEQFLNRYLEESVEPSRKITPFQLARERLRSLFGIMTPKSEDSSFLPSSATPYERMRNLRIPAKEESIGTPSRMIRDIADAETLSEDAEVKRLDEEFINYLDSLLVDRLEETIKFGKWLSVSTLTQYYFDLFGPEIFFDHMLAISQQYSICETEIVSEEGSSKMTTGFNLALFGEPGTGKSFTSRDMILGSEDKGIPPHGIPGRNRYCGGMTPAKFIEVGQAYENKKFNFIVTEFNDWFKYRGMVEPLKLAMERGSIRYETKRYTVGPYRFTSFFSVNYNTRVYDKGYGVTVSDPNFNAIEDRMLCRLHRLTKAKYQELAKSQREMMLGKMQSKMKMFAPRLRDHLTLCYAIQTRNTKVNKTFSEKRVLLTKNLFDMLDKARDLVLENLRTGIVPFSARLESRAVQLASAMSLMNYFNREHYIISVDNIAAKMATRFFVEEAWIRSGETFPIREVIRKLDLEFID